ncbi:MAG: NTP transferase domain-containing protein [Clostridia bacterium]|nr:NTP transferase domain-containing protein [Clostridia bacterium]
MNKEQFMILRYIAESRREFDREDLPYMENCSSVDIDRYLSDFLDNGLIDENYQITAEGLDALSPYKVKNAIILAAGMSTRFIPVSYELPKGLISVKGEVMTERLIRQLQDAGVGEIVLVVGYKMEKFFYLRDKFGVKLVVNNEFAVKNTHSSIYAARDYLSNTYIVCSDNYYPKNMFHQYEYRAFYCSIYLPGTSYVERAFTFDEDMLVTDTNKPSHDQWIMYGHAYYSNDFTTRFKPILESYYGRPGIEYMYWETIYAENVNLLPMWVQKCKDGDILEFDSMEELERFDPDYITHNRVKVFENICRILCCEFSDISDIEPVKKGLNNRSFKFKCNGKSYIYRHPDVNASKVIDRKKEAASLRLAKKLEIDDTLVYIDENEGWKISKYIDTTEDFDFGNLKHVSLLANKLKRLHDSKLQVGFTFDYRREADKMIEYEKFVDALSYRKIEELRLRMAPIFDWLDAHPWQKTLCHNDLYEPNMLICGDELTLIDWEFAGDNDIGYDICKLFSLQTPAYEDIDKWLYSYYGRQTTDGEKLHLLSCASIIYYYWYIWGIYASQNNSGVSDYMIGWYDKMNHYSEEVLRRI